MAEIRMFSQEHFNPARAGPVYREKHKWLLNNQGLGGFVSSECPDLMQEAKGVWGFSFGGDLRLKQWAI